MLFVEGVSPHDFDLGPLDREHERQHRPHILLSLRVGPLPRRDFNDQSLVIEAYRDVTDPAVSVLLLNVSDIRTLGVLVRDVAWPCHRRGEWHDQQHQGDKRCNVLLHVTSPLRWWFPAGPAGGLALLRAQLRDDHSHQAVLPRHPRPS